MKFDALSLAALILYASASVSAVGGLVGRSALARRLACLTGVGGFAVQTLSLVLGSHGALPGGLSLGAYLELSAWFLLLCGILGRLKFKLEAPLLFAALAAFLLTAAAHPYLHRQVVLPAELSGPFYALHIGALFLSLSLTALAFGAALLFVYMQGKIKGKKRLTGFRQDFPALAVLDKINAVCVPAGFLLYTVGIATGFIWAASVWGRSFSGDPKELVSLVIWIGYAVLFHQRTVRGRQGRMPAVFMIGLFALCLFSIVVVNALLPTHHAFLPPQTLPGAGN